LLNDENVSGTATPLPTRLPHEMLPDALLVVESPIAYTAGLASAALAAACVIVKSDNVEPLSNVRSSTPSQTATLNCVPVFVIPVVAATPSTTSEVIVADEVVTLTT